MQGIEQAYADVCIKALLEANFNLLDTSITVVTAAATAYGKGDTLALDAIPEIGIETTLARFDDDAILITEELGQKFAERMDTCHGVLPTLFFCDPTDRSSYFCKFLQDQQRGEAATRVGDVIRAPDTIAAWEQAYAAPATITGATSAITCVRGGLPIFTIILNYITQELIFIAKAGVRIIPLPACGTPGYEGLNVERILQSGKEVQFLPLGDRAHSDERKNFFTFLGKSGYRENFRDCGIFAGHEERQPLYELPGGPSRALYLSDLYRDRPAGFILANGEKIVEWVHWLTVVRFARCNGERALELFEITHERPWTREGISMAPSSAYSIFRPDAKGLTRIDVRPLGTLPRPSQFRSTLAIAPTDNSWFLHTMRINEHRKLVFSQER